MKVTLKKGVDGYAGTTDTWMGQRSPENTSNMGGSVILKTFRTSDRMLMERFDLSSIPAFATVLDARLEMFVETNGYPSADGRFDFCDPLAVNIEFAMNNGFGGFSRFCGGAWFSFHSVSFLSVCETDVNGIRVLP